MIHIRVERRHIFDIHRSGLINGGTMLRGCLIGLFQLEEASTIELVSDQQTTGGVLPTPLWVTFLQTCINPLYSDG